MKTLLINKAVWDYWKRGTFILISLFGVTLMVLIITVLNWNFNTSFFLSYLQTNGQMNWEEVSTIIVVIGAYIYLLFLPRTTPCFYFERKYQRSESEYGVSSSI